MLQLQKKMQEEQATMDEGVVLQSGGSSPVQPDSDQAMEVDHCIEKAFNIGDQDSLMQLLHVLLSEGYPINYRVSSFFL